MAQTVADLWESGQHQFPLVLDRGQERVTLPRKVARAITNKNSCLKVRTRYAAGEWVTKKPKRNVVGHLSSPRWLGGPLRVA